MHAVILAGGRGRRLGPITDCIPKPLVPIRNVPIIEWQIKYLKRLGVGSITVCTGYRAEQIEDHLGSRKGLGVDVSFSIERTPLGTGGAIKRAGRKIKGSGFLVLNGDVITDIDARKMFDAPDSIAAIPLRTKFGVMHLDGNKITEFSEKKRLAGVYMNAGIYYLSKDIIHDLPAKGDIESTVFPKYARAGRLHNVLFKDAAWHSIDSLKDLEECGRHIQNIIK